MSDRSPAAAAPAMLDKLCERSGLAAALAHLPRPWVFTNGVFDVLHRGHVVYLAQARALGGSLIVALNTDASARRLGKADSGQKLALALKKAPCLPVKVGGARPLAGARTTSPSRTQPTTARHSQPMTRTAP